MHMQIGFLGPAFFLTQLGKVSTVGGAVGCMMACQGLDACSQSGLYSNHQVTTADGRNELFWLRSDGLLFSTLDSDICWCLL